MSDKIQKTNAEWKAQLTPQQYEVTRHQATDPPFTGSLLHNEETGIYSCVCCGLELFSSKSKFDSGSGWPSFYEPIRATSVETQADNSLGRMRTEVHCPRCGAHLGHVFQDGPQPTGLRYCINSSSLKFEEE